MQTLKQFMRKEGLSQADLARALGVSPTAISQYLGGRYGEQGGDAAALKARLGAYMANYVKQTPATDLPLVATQDVRMVDAVCRDTVRYKEMGVIYGKAGSGKTVAIKTFSEKHPEAVLIETIPIGTTRGLLMDILRHLGQREPAGSQEALYREVVARFKRAERILIIDEAENLNTTSLNVVRRIHDFTRTPVILVGAHALIGNLKGREGRLLQIYSRAQNKHQMTGLTVADRQALFGDFGAEIKRYTDDLRRSASIYKKAKRYAEHDGVPLAARHIQVASNTVILD